jgi:hypothetical protein
MRVLRLMRGLGGMSGAGRRYEGGGKNQSADFGNEIIIDP